MGIGREVVDDLVEATLCTSRSATELPKISYNLKRKFPFCQRCVSRVKVRFGVVYTL